jgi:hypothetical protein
MTYMRAINSVIHTVQLRCAQGVGGERDHWGDQDLGGRIILRWIFRKWEGGLWGLDGVGSG